MSYRRRFELLQERRRLRAVDEYQNRELYYSHRLKLSEEILSRLFSKKVALTVKRGWVHFNDKNYRVYEIEALALRLDALSKEREDAYPRAILGDQGSP